MGTAALELIMTLKDEASAKLKEIEGGLGGVNKGALLLGAGAVVAVGAFAKGLYDCAQAAIAEEVGIMQLGAAVAATGTSYASVSAEIETYIAAAQRKVGFDDGVQRESIARLTMTTGSYQTALNLLPLAMDLARAKGMDLAAASEIVGKVNQGNTGILSRYGIVLQEGATAQEAIAAMQGMFAGQAEAYGNTVAGKAALMGQQFDNLKETIGAYLLPVLLSLFTALGDIAATAIPMVEQAIGFLKANADIIIPVFVAMAATIMIGLIPAFIAWASAATAAAIATITALAPVLIPIAAVGAAVAVLALAWRENFGGIQEKTETVINFIRPFIEQAITNIQTVVTTILGAIQSFWSTWGDTITGMVQTVWAAIQTYIGNVMAVIQGIIKTVTALIHGDWKGAWEGIQDTSSSIWSGIQGMISGVLAAIQGVIGGALAAIQGVVGGAWSAVEGVTSGAWNAIQGVITGVWNAIKAAIQLSLGLILALLTGDFATVQNIARTAWEAVKGVIVGAWPGIVSGVTQAVDNVRLAMGNAWNTIYNAAVSAFNNIKTAITSPITDAVGVIRGLVDSIIGAFMSIGQIHIPMPHFTWSTRDVTIAGLTFPIPDIGINWYGKGMPPTMFNQPTLIGVGESGPEVVSVTPAGQSGGGKEQSFSFVYNDYSGGGRAAFEQIAQKLEFRYRYGL